MNEMNGNNVREKIKKGEGFEAIKSLENGKEELNSDTYKVCNIDKVVEELLMEENAEEESVTDYSIDSIITKEMLEEERKLESKALIDEKEMKQKLKEEERKMNEEKCFKRLHLLLSRSSVYAKFLADKLERHELSEKKRQKRKHDVDNRMNGLKRIKKEKNQVNVMEVYKDKNMASLEYQESSSDNNRRNCGHASINNIEVEDHPSLFYGGKMRPYQIEGFEWLKVLYENGVNGILADEMGLGKTIQCIAFIAHLIEMGVPGPFFVCGPLSTLPNWYSEFKRFTPDIPVILYHGNKEKRRELIKDFNKKVKVDKNISCCPVVLTSYQLTFIDSNILMRVEWKMLVIDEAHRIKNHECSLIKALKQFKVDQRLLLTGTPLQNNLTELWSLLNFILPEIFDDLRSFQSWFDISKLSQNKADKEIMEKEKEKQIVSIIHQILTPFLLRRTKSEVELDLPPKKEIIVYAPLTSLQEKYYKAVLNRTIDRMLRPKSFFDPPTTSKRKPKQAEFFGCSNVNINHLIQNVKVSQTQNAAESKDFSDADILNTKLNLKLQNCLMCLRKITLHPYLISQPLDFVMDENFINLSGKTLVLDALLKEMKKRNHKVIIFSQFVSFLSLLEEYCVFRGFKYVSLYGDMVLEERQENLKEFKEESTFLFLISTRAGGLGLNLIEADTVIIVDSDWNPQCDLQAQDRCHRIGQTKPVVVYRLIVSNSIDEKILDYATAKRKLEKVIIQKGRFKSSDINRSQKPLAVEELLNLLQSSDNSCFVKTDENCVLSPEELEKLLDRSDM